MTRERRVWHAFRGDSRRTTRPMPAAHILTYARDLTGGGVERALLRLAGGWVAAGGA